MVKIRFNKKRAGRSPITNELRAKHALGMTLSPLDLSFRKGMINESMHRAANRFIFLHNARFGLASMKCRTSWNYEDGFTHRDARTDEELALIREEYFAVSKMLQSIKSYKFIMNVCIYDHYPGFLRCVGNIKEDFYDEYLLFKNSLKSMDKFISHYISNKTLG